MTIPWYKRDNDPNKQYEKAIIRHKMVVARNQARHNGATIIEDIYRLEIYARDKGICGLCGLPINQDELALDHKTPIKRGGQHTHNNVHAAHIGCNSSKRNQTLEEWNRNV